MIAKTPTFAATCDACGDQTEVPLENRGNGLWYDGGVDSALEALGWYVLGDTVVCDLCHAQSLDGVG